MWKQQTILLATGLFLLTGVGRADWRHVEEMQAGAPIMVHAGFVTNSGKFVRASPDAITVQTQSGDVIVLKADVDDVYIFRPHTERVHKGLLIGGIAAGATAAA